MALHPSTAKVVRGIIGLTGIVAAAIGFFGIPGKLNWFAGALLLYGSGFWPYLVVLAVEIFAAYTGRSSDYQLNFYRTIQDDLRVAGISALAIAGIYLLSTAHYEAGSFDIFSAAVPFLVLSLFTAFRVTQKKLMGKAMQPRHRAQLLVMLAATCVLFFWIATRVASSSFNLMASTWVQVTILCVSVFLYVESRRMEYVLDVGKIELSPVLLSIFGSDGSYGQMGPIAQRWNLAVSQYEQEATKPHKKKRKR